MNPMISIYNNITQTKNGKDLPFDIFLDNIRDGKWQDFVLPIRAMKPEHREPAKKKVPYVTLSGKFSERADIALIAHSGYIGIDIDDVEDTEELKSVLCPDKYIYACFTSISGRGLCAVFKINGEKHRESYEAISEYLFERYRVITDPTGINPSRARFISYDPHIYVNQGAEKFTSLPKRKAEKKVPQVIYVQTDFDAIVQEIASRMIDIVPNYHEWLRIGFALCDKFSETGRAYFHNISRIGPDYNEKLCDKQYTNCLKRKNSGITIATLYYYAKQAGISTVSQQTKLISQTAHFAKKGARTKESAVQYLKEAEGIAPAVSEPIITQVFDNNIKVDVTESPIDDVELWLKQNYELRRNVITRKIENREVDVEEEDLNSMFITAKKIFDKILTSEIFNKLIFSRFVPDFNPFFDFFQKHIARKPKGLIKALFDTIESDTGLGHNEFFPDYKYHFGSKWFVGLISAMHGTHSPLMIVLSGNKQGTGKTEFWNRLLPVELKKYYAESKLERGKDDEILMTQKILILDDEMSAKDEKAIASFKRLTSKQTFSLRAPYGKHNVDLNRLTVLCGTTQENEILSDPTGNRRIIPINTLSINHTAYNAIDKIDLIMEAYWMYKEGFAWQLDSYDVEMLNKSTGYFEKASAEFDLIVKHFDKPETIDDNTPFMTPTEIKSVLEMRTMQKLNHVKLGMELKRLGFEKQSMRNGHKFLKGYYIIDKFKVWVDSKKQTEDS